jgi:hypothetical protein
MKYFLWPPIRAKIANRLNSLDTWTDEHRIIFKMLVLVKDSTDCGIILSELTGKHEAQVVYLFEELSPAVDRANLAMILLQTGKLRWEFSENNSSNKPFVSPFANYVWLHGDISNPFPGAGFALESLHYLRPDLIRSWIQQLSKIKFISLKQWHSLASLSKDYDACFISAIQAGLENPTSAHGAEGLFNLIQDISAMRNDEYQNQVIELLKHPNTPPTSNVINLLINELPDQFCSIMLSKSNFYRCDDWNQIFELAIKDLNGDGGLLFEKVIGSVYLGIPGRIAIETLLTRAPSILEDTVVRLIRKGAEGRFIGESRRQDGLPVYWGEVAKHSNPILASTMKSLLSGTVQISKEISAKWLAANATEESARLAEFSISSKNINDRVSGVILLSELGGESSQILLKKMHSSETSIQVKNVIARIMERRKVILPTEPDVKLESPQNLFDFEQLLHKRIKSIKHPKASWLDIKKLPGLVSNDGRILSTLATSWLMQQAARSPGLMAPGVAPIHPFLDRSRNSVFAHALLDQWFSSGMTAADRWALDVAGMVGSDCIIPRLIEPIPAWCEKNHGSRGEWAARAIALLGTNQALVSLELLIQRFREHRKYIGEAALQAQRSCGRMMGMCEDELAERIVPTFDFDPKGLQGLFVKRGEMMVQLQPNFSLTWLYPGQNDFEKKLPSKLLDIEQLAAKNLRKSVKQEAVRLARRLELAMINRRRWEISTWQIRFEHHPIFRMLATQLIWGVYDNEGRVLRTFRLDQDGTKTDSASVIERFDGNATCVGLVHCMEIDDAMRKAWKVNLSRFKIKPVFKQIDRKVYLLHPMESSLTRLRLTENRKLKSNQLRKIMLGRGWTLAELNEGNWMYGIWKRFPGFLIDVFLPVDGLAPPGRMDTDVTLSATYFSRTNTAQVNYRSFPGESAEIPLGEVPPVVYSETLADLYALGAGKA